MREVTAVILENKKIADEVFSLTFATEEEIPIKAGQFCMIGIGGHALRRPSAVCKAEGVRITVCYRLKGEGTRSLASDYKAGEKISVLLPLGNGFSLTESQKKIVVVGGGVGIFPLISVIREFSNEKEIYAYMGFRNRDAVCMESELQRTEKFVISTDDGSVGHHGTAVQALMKDWSEIRPDAVLACGPAPMLRALKEAVKGKNVPVYVSLEERMGCGIGACLVCTCNKQDGTRARVCKDGPVFEIGEVEL